MKTTNLKSLFVVGMTALSTITTTYSFASVLPTPALAGNNMAASKQHKLVQGDLERIYTHRLKIEGIEKSIDANKEAKNKEAVMQDRKALKKAEADLKRDKTYLCLDKRTAMCDQHKAISAAKDQKCGDKKDLRQAKRTLRRDERKDNNERVAWDQRQVGQLRDKIKNDDMAENKLIQDRKQYARYIKDEMNKPHETVADADMPAHPLYAGYWVMLF